MSPVSSEQFAVQFQASKERAASLRKLPKGSHIHISGVCGTGMASVLQLLKILGYTVTGSDKAFYPPMGDVVRKIADKVFEGYRAENLQPKPDFLVIGNSLMKDNPEVLFAEEQRIPFASMPEVFSALLVGERSECPESIVVCGTHGKTTTTAAIATLFDSAGRKPGFFVGGIPQNFDTSIRPVPLTLPVEKRSVILEGDEYDSAYFAKWAKFLSYRADIALLTSLEFDHADIYESIEQIEEEFSRLFRQVPASGALVICDQGAELETAVGRWRGQGFPAPLYRYGESLHSEFRLVERRPQGDGQALRFLLRGKEVSLKSPLSGPHNALNLLGAAAAADLSGLSLEEIRIGLESFRGVLRRQQIIADLGGILILEDFAHHPTAVAVTLQGLREQYPGRRIIAVFEPRSNTSRRAVFQDSYRSSFAAADIAVILEVLSPAAYSGTTQPNTMLDVSRLINEIRNSGVQAHCFPSVAALEEFLLAELKPSDVVAIMSNGDFGGLMRSLPGRIRQMQT